MIREVYTEHSRGVNPMDMNWCPSVATLVGTDLATGQTILLPIRCRRWTCPYCQVPNEILLKERVQSGNPNRMVTLTVRPEPGDSPIATFWRFRPAIPRLWQLCRRYLGQWEAVTFTELHRSGQPHWHALVRSPYLPQTWLSARWRHLTGSWIVDIRAIRDAALARRYVTKYVTKQMQTLRRSRLGYIVTFTRHYSLKDKTIPAKSPFVWYRDKRHPIEVAERGFKGFHASWNGHVCTLTPPTSHDLDKCSQR